MIYVRGFSEFISTAVKTVNREQKEKARWELYLHQIHCAEFAEAYPTFGSYVEALELDERRREKSNAGIETVVENSYRMIESFTPDENM